MQLPDTQHPHLQALGDGLERSLERHVVGNSEIRTAFAELAFEVQVAKSFDTYSSSPITSRV